MRHFMRHSMRHILRHGCYYINVFFACSLISVLPMVRGCRHRPVQAQHGIIYAIQIVYTVSF